VQKEEENKKGQKKEKEREFGAAGPEKDQ